MTTISTKQKSILCNSESLKVRQFLRICNWEKLHLDLALQSFFHIAKGLKLSRLSNFLIALSPIAFFKL